MSISVEFDSANKIPHFSQVKYFAPNDIFKLTKFLSPSKAIVKKERFALFVEFGLFEREVA